MSGYYRDDRDYDRPPRRSAPEVATEVLVRERESRTPAFLRDPGPRRGEAGPMVLRREVETTTRRRSSPSPPPFREERVMERIVRRRNSSPSPIRRRSPSRGRGVSIDRVRVRRDSSYSSYSSSPEPVIRRAPRGRPRSLSPEWKETEVTVVKRQRSPSPRPAPPPPPPEPQVIRGPTIEREVITHYTDIDHGVVVARPPSPKPMPRGRSRSRHRDTEIDIFTSRNETDIDIHTRDHSHNHGHHHGHSMSRARSKSRHHHYDDEQQIVVVDRTRNSQHLTVGGPSSRRRAHSAAPLPRHVRDEADEITGIIDSRGRMGEAYGGATRDWTIIDVPPGTERVRMDGVGGGSAEVNWSRYSGVRRTKFVPEPRETSNALVPIGQPQATRGTSSNNNELSVHVHTSHHGHGHSRRPSRSRGQEMWTEISRDLVCREAVRIMGYPYEETKWFIYIMDYLRQEEVQRLVSMSTDIRRQRRLKMRQQARVHDDLDIQIHRHRHHSHAPSPHRGPRPFVHEDDRYIEREREVIVDNHRGYRY